MWDIRDGMCKQTFTGHESDINAITVRLRYIRLFLDANSYRVRHTHRLVDFIQKMIVVN